MPVGTHFMFAFSNDFEAYSQTKNEKTQEEAALLLRVVLADHAAVVRLVERFGIEPSSDFSAIQVRRAPGARLSTCGE